MNDTKRLKWVSDWCASIFSDRNDPIERFIVDWVGSTGQRHHTAWQKTPQDAIDEAIKINKRDGLDKKPVNPTCFRKAHLLSHCDCENKP